MRFLLAVSLVAAVAAPGAQRHIIQKKTMPSMKIENILAAHTDSLMSIEGVVGVGIGELKGKPCIKVMLDKKTRRRIKLIPKSLDGFPVVIEETGEFKPRGETPPY
jgi:hypothetical protein